jgi:mannose-6-phosphate isomerase-like protein (cupin superfamily)
MKKSKLIIGSILTLALVYLITPLSAKKLIEAYILEHENDIALKQAGSHKGGGETIGYSFFAKAKDLNLVFRKRVFKPGSAIGYHLQKEDEIYYIVSGTGEMQMNGKTFPVKAGDAILTRPGSSHGLKQTGNEDLTIIINYEKH